MKTVIEMAREAGFEQIDQDVMEWSCFDDEIQRFAELVRADERDRAMRENAYVQAEREACAKLCDEQAERSNLALEKSMRTIDQAVYSSGAQTAAWNAAAIRARGEASIRGKT